MTYRSLFFGSVVCHERYHLVLLHLGIQKLSLFELIPRLPSIPHPRILLYVLIVLCVVL